jgi:hypothetical protein
VRSCWRLDAVKAWPNNTVSSLKGRLYVNAKFRYNRDPESLTVGEYPPGTTPLPFPRNVSGLWSNSSGMPIWFLIVLTSALATVPWIRWRFSLRTLLIATTLVAVVLGLIIYAAR